MREKGSAYRQINSRKPRPYIILPENRPPVFQSEIDQIFGFYRTDEILRLDLIVNKSKATAITGCDLQIRPVLIDAKI